MSEDMFPVVAQSADVQWLDIAKNRLAQGVML